MKKGLAIPADVPCAAQESYKQNSTAISNDAGKLFLFAADHKIEHLNKDFYGEGISADSADPENLFRIASTLKKGAFATQLGLIDRYGKNYSSINYIVKLNSKTDLVPLQDKEPLSQQLWSVADVLELKAKSNLAIRGVGYTIYLGSEYEQTMLAQAAQIIQEAHRHGLLVILWIYARGKAIKDDRDAQLLAGAAGLANSLGADFVKIKEPHLVTDLSIIAKAAGNTHVIISGGTQKDIPSLFTQTYEQMQQGASGCAVGRNVFQRSFTQACALVQALTELVYDNIDAHSAQTLYETLIKTNKK